MYSSKIVNNEMKLKLPTIRSRIYSNISANFESMIRALSTPRFGASVLCLNNGGGNFKRLFKKF